MRRERKEIAAGILKIAIRYLEGGGLAEDFNSLDAKTRITVFMRLLPYLLKGTEWEPTPGADRELRDTLLRRAGLILQ